MGQVGASFFLGGGGANITWEKKNKSLIQTRDKLDLKEYLQFQQFWLGSELLRHFISAFPFSTKS